MLHLGVLEGILELPPEVVYANIGQFLEQAGEVVVAAPLVLVLASVSRGLLPETARPVRAAVLSFERQTRTGTHCKPCVATNGEEIMYISYKKSKG